MLKLAKFLKPFTYIILFVIILVFVQTMADLKLPDLMSEIVNDGLSKVEYSIDEEKIKEAMATGQISMEALTKMQEKFGNDANSEEDQKEMQDRMKNMFTGKEAVSSEELALFGKIQELGILKAEAKPDEEFIYKTGAKMLGVALISALSTIAVALFSSRVAAKVGVNLRKAIFAQVEKFSLKEINKVGTSSLITRTTNDVQQIQVVVFMILRMILGAPIMFIGGVYMAIQKSPSLAMNLIYVIPAIAIIIAVIAKKAMSLFRLSQKKLDKLNAVTREGLTGVRAIRAYNKAEYEINRFDTANKELTDTALKVNKIMAVLMPALMLIMNLTIVATLWFGAKQVDVGNILVGDIMAFIQYAFQILFSLMMFTMVFVLLPRASASAERINEVLEIEPEIKEPDECRGRMVCDPGLHTMQPLLEFKNVTFTYPGAENSAVEDISFSLMPGKTTAIIGGTGSGKSTLINLIMRFYDATKGEILLDGINIKNMTTYLLRQKIGYIPQKALLFSGTISENLKFGNDSITDEDIKKVTEIAQATEFINEKENKFEEVIAQGGGNVSGGQRQRLSIARALAKKAEVYLFDDSFSALDFKTDAKLRKALKTYTEDAAVLIVAQRVSTVMDSDQIIVLDDGKIVGIGTHKLLIESCDVYKEIVYSQVSKEELEQEEEDN